MRNFVSKLFLNEYGKISWTTISAFFALIIGFHTYIDIWWLHKEYSAALLQFALEIILTGLGVRGAQRGLQYLGEGVGSISAKKTIQETTKKTTTVESKKQAAPKVQKQVSTGNFSVSEFNSKDGAEMPAHVEQNIHRLIQNLEVIREQFGGRPIKITSGYRSPERNAQTKGAAKSSYHILGMAADFSVRGLSPEYVATKIKEMMDVGLIEQGGLKAYRSWVHYDIRGNFISWGKNAYNKVG